MGLLALFVVVGLFNHARAGAPRDEGIQAEANLTEYAGSLACGVCHKAHYKHWQSSAMSHFVRSRDDMAGPMPGNWKTSPIHERKDQIRVVVGVVKKAAFVTDDWQVLPFQYHFKKREWQRRDKWAEGDTDYRSRCGVCHLTGLNRESRAFVEMGVGCEVCHGPGGRHAQTKKASDVLRIPSKDNAADLKFCRRCHNQRQNHARALEDYDGRFHPQSINDD